MSDPRQDQIRLHYFVTILWYLVDLLVAVGVLTFGLTSTVPKHYAGIGLLLLAAMRMPARAPRLAAGSGGSGDSDEAPVKSQRSPPGLPPSSAYSIVTGLTGHTMAAVALVLALGFAPAVVAVSVGACTPSARQQASGMISTFAPVGCQLFAVFGGEKFGQAGVVCADVAKLLSDGLLLARVERGEYVTPTASVVGELSSCTWVPLRSVDASRDEREGICAEPWGGVESAKVAIRNALGMHHAR